MLSMMVVSHTAIKETSQFKLNLSLGFNHCVVNGMQALELLKEVKYVFKNKSY